MEVEKKISWLRQYAQDAVDKTVKLDVTSMNNAEFRALLKIDVIRANQVLAQEVVEKSLLSAFVQLNRVWEIYKSCIYAKDENNLYSFSSNFRSLLEFCGDGVYSLKPVIKFLSQNSDQLVSAYRGNLKSIVRLEKSLEDLDHFLFAGKKGYVKNFSAKKYISAINPDLYQIYGELCEYSHPASLGNFMWLQQHDEIQATFCKLKYTTHTSEQISRFLPVMYMVAVNGFSVALILIELIVELDLNLDSTKLFDSFDFKPLNEFRVLFEQ